jgi:hypothetical protein
MEKLESQFEGALTKIEISGPKRDRAGPFDEATHGHHAQLWSASPGSS